MRHPFPQDADRASRRRRAGLRKHLAEHYREPLKPHPLLLGDEVLKSPFDIASQDGHWIAAMLCVTVSSFWIREINHGALSWIHGLTVWTLFSMFVAVWGVRRWRVRLHAGFMVGSMAGTVVAGGFAFAPSRLIGRLLGY